MRFVINRRVYSAFATNEHGALLAPSSYSCDCLGVANYLKVRFCDVLARWFLATQMLAAQTTFTDVDELCEARVPEYTSDVSIRGHRYKYIMESRLGLVTWVKDLRDFDGWTCSCSLDAAMIELNLRLHGNSYTPPWVCIHSLCRPVLPSCHHFYSYCAYFALFLWSGSRWFRQGCCLYPTSLLLHSSLNGNNFPRYWRTTYWICCQVASKVV